VLGLETYQRHNPGEVKNAVREAIDVGYRYFECAWINENEAEVGKAISEKIHEGAITRDDVFVSTKLWNNFHARSLVSEMLRCTLKTMGLAYVDLFLIHWPMGFKHNCKTLPLKQGKDAYSDVDYLETWKGMEDCVILGLTKSIGLANFNIEQVRRVVKHAKYKPVVNQIEVHPHFNQKALIQSCRDEHIAVVGYCPFGINEKSGVPNFPEPSILDDRIDRIAYKHGKTAAQIVLKYLITCLGVCVVPKAVSQFRIREYYDISDFELDASDVKTLDTCNRNERICLMSAFADHKYYPFDLSEIPSRSIETPSSTTVDLPSSSRLQTPSLRVNVSSRAPTNFTSRMTFGSNTRMEISSASRMDSSSTSRTSAPSTSSMINQRTTRMDTSASSRTRTESTTQSPSSSTM
jgi:aldehyde reductase